MGESWGIYKFNGRHLDFLHKIDYNNIRVKNKWRCFIMELPMADYMKAKVKLPYDAKVAHAEVRAWEFYNKIIGEGGNCHVSVGGLDSLTLLFFLRKIGIDVPAISVSSLEKKSIREVHKELGVINISSGLSQSQVLQKYGFPVISKEKARKISYLLSDKELKSTKTAMTGWVLNGNPDVAYRKKLPDKWIKKFGGKVAYMRPDIDISPTLPNFKVSEKCCYHLKEKPLNNWAKEHNSSPFLGLMMSEGGPREIGLLKNGCNYYGKTMSRSCPFAIFSRQDLLQLALDLDVPTPSVYGTIEKDENGLLYTTGAQRTGCNICGFGIHLEKRPHRFDRLREENPKEWEYWMYKCCEDDDGTKYGWARVLDFIGVEYL